MSLKRAFLAGVCVVGLIGFGQPTLASDFTFKRVGVKKSTGGSKSGKRINIQIAPEEDYYKKLHREKKAKEEAKGAAGEAAKTDPQKPAKPKTKAVADLQEWFWQSNSGLIKDGKLGRMHTAMASLANHPKEARGMTANIGHYQSLAEKHGKDILLATLGQEVSPALVLAVIGVESSGRTDAVSTAGAVGLMQLIPETAKRFDVTDSTDPAQNIKGGAAYLAWLLKEFDSDPLLALAGYNAGENAVKSHGGVPPYPETRSYVPKVVAAWQVARTLCLTPPKFATDGCVFKPVKTAKTQAEK